MPPSSPSAARDVASAARQTESDVRLVTHLASLRQLSRSVSHEMLGTLNSVSLNLDLLGQSMTEIEEPALRTRQERYVSKLSESLRRFEDQLGALISAIRSRPTEGGRFDWCESLASQKLLIEAHATDRRSPSRLAMPQHPVILEGDRDAIDQVVLALAVWAFETAVAAPQGDVHEEAPVAITLEARPPRAVLALRVRVGPGAPAIEGEPGALGVARQVARRHDGELRITADAGAMLVELDLPLATKRN